MTFTRLGLIAILPLFTAKPHASTLHISVTTGPSASAPMRIIATAGTVVSGGRTYRAATDTLSLIGSAELTSDAPMFMATFISDSPGNRIKVAVTNDGAPSVSGSGDAIVVVRTPQGAQIQAMPVPAELRRSR